MTEDGKLERGKKENNGRKKCTLKSVIVAVSYYGVEGEELCLC